MATRKIDTVAAALAGEPTSDPHAFIYSFLHAVKDELHTIAGALEHEEPEIGRSVEHLYRRVDLAIELFEDLKNAQKGAA